jgi:very-short-patch-repair endonuclease
MEESTDNVEQESKAIRLLEFLTRIALLRTKLARDVSDYARVFWLDEIPKHKACFTRAWGSDENVDADVWIEVQSQREPELPRIPALCEDWVDRSTLRSTRNLPTLLTELTRQVESPARQDGSDPPEFISFVESIEDHPEVQAAWDRYVDERWLSWAETHMEWESAHKAYAGLFSIHQEQLRLGEEYELVLGVGLLNWQTPSGQHVRRHLLVANAILEFEASLGKFTVRPMPDGANLRPELDMLDVDDQPAHAEEAAKLSLANGADDPWDHACLDRVLQALVHSLSSRGEYHDALARTKPGDSEKPIVTFAPALILRKRSARGLTEALKRIKGRIDLGEEIPSEFQDLAEIAAANSAEAPHGPSQVNGAHDSEVFFPKLSNDEQRRIVDVLRVSNGVLVQGPPGTGKSHTIANLICHLLATGQRTLVTAKTPRALHVLQQLIPEELRPLCINLLGSGLEEKQSLEASVGGILRERDRWNEALTHEKRIGLEVKLNELRREKATLNRRLRDIRESETHSHAVGEGAYRGTAARIAESVNRDRSTFEWFAHSADSDIPCPKSEDQLQSILIGLRQVTIEKRQELSLAWPKDVPSTRDFGGLVEEERKTTEELERANGAADGELAEKLSWMDASSIELLRTSFIDLQDALRRRAASIYPWMHCAVREIIGGNPELWRELLRITDEGILASEALIARADDANLSITLPNGSVRSALDDIDARILLDDACCLKKHLEDGGKLGWWVFRPPVVKERQYLLKNVRINGQVCSSVEQLSLLNDLLRVHLALEKSWQYWASHFAKPHTPYALQLRTLQSLRTALDDALSLEGLVDECRETLRLNPALPTPNWLDESQIERLIASCWLALVKQSWLQAQAGLRAIEEPVAALAARNDAHPIAERLLQAIRVRDAQQFECASNVLRQLDNDRDELRRLDDEINDLRRQLPTFADRFVASYNDPRWDTRLEKIQEAWRWNQARFWIEEHIRKEDVPSLVARVRQIEVEVHATIEKLASLQAWSHCFSRLTENHRRHMVAWQQSMRKLGKGTGKHAGRHRREAQQQLNECREAVPAWVMPLHRVWDTVDPAAGMFDVVIVDEASQCGVEALPLLYLGKKILIVGDDKQISPDAVGLPRDAVHNLMNQFLYDFSFKAFFDVESSLFDHGKLRYGTRCIILREHFRCMPEIIRFSNSLCYSDTPLIPLRQYGPNRLPPLQHRFVDRGYREGTGNRVVNRPEAEDIVAKIAELCRDPRYADKTMGVIVLQGEAQASLITDLLLEQLDIGEMLHRRLVCGNAYSFQGDERDIMFLSMVAAPNERIGPLAKPADERRFNVAASRARDQLWLFHSVCCDDLSPSCLRRRLLEFFVDDKPQQIAGVSLEEIERRAAQDNRRIIQPPRPFDSWFEVDVALQLIRKGFNIVPQYELAGKRIDLVVEGGDQARLAIECDGDRWHGVDQYEADMQRQRMLERCGLEFYRVRESTFYANPEQSMQNVWRLLQERGIAPGRISSTRGSATKQSFVDGGGGEEHSANCSERESPISELAAGTCAG